MQSIDFKTRNPTAGKSFVYKISHKTLKGTGVFFFPQKENMMFIKIYVILFKQPKTHHIPITSHRLCLCWINRDVNTSGFAVIGKLSIA